MQRVFGRLPDGDDIHAITLRSDAGLCAEVLSYGGILRRLQLPVGGRVLDLVLGLDDLEAYLADTDSLGILVGRFGNRIAGGRAMVDGVVHQLSRNEGPNHLHGGVRGFGRRRWNVAAVAPDHVLLERVSPAGEEGYPGTLRVSAALRVHGCCLELDYRASCDAPTPVNLTHHPYFNLAGDAAVPASAQWLQVPADRWLPVDQALLPSGEIAGVAGTPFDFRTAATLDARRVAGDPQLRNGGGYDHCLVLEDGAPHSAELYSPHSGVAMRMTSPMPAVQLYEGQGLDRGHPGLGRGVCLEPQGFPDAPSHAHFPDAILRPGVEYRHHIVYRFAVPGPGADWSAVRDALDRTPC